MVAFGSILNVLLISAMVLQVTVVLNADSNNLRKHSEIRMRSSISQGNDTKKLKFKGKEMAVRAKEAWKNHQKKVYITSGLLLGGGAIYVAIHSTFGGGKGNKPNPVSNGSSNFQSIPPTNEDEWINMLTYLVIGLLIIGALTLAYFYFCRSVEEDEEADMPANATAAAFNTAFGGFKGAGPNELMQQHFSVKKGNSKSAGRPVGTPATSGPPANTTSQGSVTPKLTNTSTG